MQDHRPARSSRFGGRLCAWIERALLIAGVLTLAWCAVVVGGAVVAQRLARQSLEAAMSVAPVAPSVVASALPGAARIQARVEELRAGAPIAALSIPRVELSAVVLHGSDAHTLRRGPGHVENTALPGASGNVVIVGHRDSFFRPLRHVTVGDEIVLDTPGGRFRYTVTWLRVVEPRDIGVMAPTDDAVLTLITCYPFWLLGDAPQRFVVRAAVATDGPAPKRTIAALPLTPQPGASPVAVLPVPAARPAAGPFDDAQMVRQAVERFRLAYNMRRRGREPATAARQIGHQRCDVSVQESRATAVCAGAGPSSASPRHIRTFTLERANGAWAIRAISVEERLEKGADDDAAVLTDTVF